MAANSESSGEFDDFDEEDFDDEFDDDFEEELDDEYELADLEEVTEEDLAEDESSDIGFGDFVDEDEEGAAEPAVPEEPATEEVEPAPKKKSKGKTKAAQPDDGDDD
jgi:hypothetical protein